MTSGGGGILRIAGFCKIYTHVFVTIYNCNVIDKVKQVLLNTYIILEKQEWIYRKRDDRIQIEVRNENPFHTNCSFMSPGYLGFPVWITALSLPLSYRSFIFYLLSRSELMY